MASIGKVTVDVVPVAKGFHASIDRQLKGNAGMRALGAQHGKAYQAGLIGAMGGGALAARTAAATGAAMGGGKTRRRARHAGGSIAVAFGAGLGDAITRQQRSPSSGFGKVFNAGAINRRVGLRGGSTWFRVGQTAAESQAAGFVKGAASSRHKVGAARDTLAGRVGRAAVYSIPQPKSGKAASGLLAMSAQTPKMLKLAGGVAAVGAALVGVALVAKAGAAGMKAYGNFAVGALQQAGQLEQTGISLETLTGSAAAGQKLLRESIEFAKETPFDLPSVTLGIRQLAAYGFEAKSTIPIMQDIGDASAALGVGADGMSRIVRAFGQIRSRGTFRADEARQLTEVGIPAWEALEKAYKAAGEEGITQEKLQKMAAAGAIDASFAIKAFRTHMQQSFGGGMEKQALTYLGTLEKIKEASTVGISQGIQPALKGIALEVRKATPALEKFSESLGAGLGAGVAGFAAQVAGPMEAALSGLTVTAREMSAEFGVRFGAISADMIEGFSKLTPILEGITDQVYNTTAGLAGLFNGFSGIAGGIAGAADSGNGFMSFLGGVNDAMQSVVNFALPQLNITGWLASLGEGFRDMEGEAVAKVQALGTQIQVKADSIEGLDLEKMIGGDFDLGAVGRGAISEIQKVQDYLAANPDSGLEKQLGITAEALQEEIDSAAGGVNWDKLTGAPEIHLEVVVGKEKAEKSILGLAADLASVGKYSKLGIDLDVSKLQEVDTAVVELKKLKDLSDSQLQMVFGIDTSQIAGKRAEIDQLISTLQYTDASIDIKVRHDQVQSGMQQVAAMVDGWVANASQKNILVGAEIRPGDLAKFNPAAIKKLLNLSSEQLTELGIKPKLQPGFKGQLKALLAGGAGTEVELNTKLKPPKSNVKDFARGKKVPLETKLKKPKKLPPVKLGKLPIPTVLKKPDNADEPVADPPPIEVDVEVNAGSAAASAGEAAEATTSAFALGLGQGIGPVTSAGETLGTGATGGMTTGGAGSNDIGAGIASGLAQGVLDGKRAAYDAGFAVGQAAVQGQRDGSQSKSPSKLAIQVGKDIGEGLAIGLEGSKSRVYKGAAGMTKGMFGPGVDKSFNKYLNTARTIRSKSKAINQSTRSIMKSDPAHLVGAGDALNQRTQFLNDSAYKLELASHKAQGLQKKLDKRQERLDKKIKKGKPNAAQKKEQKAIDERQKYLDKRNDQIDRETWLNRREERSIEMDQRTVDRRARQLENESARNAYKDQVEDATGSGAESVKDSIDELEKQITRGEIPLALREDAEKTLAELKVIWAKEKLTEAFEPLKEAFSASSMRNLTGEGLREWRRGVEESITDSELSEGQKDDLRLVLADKVRTIEDAAEKLDRINKARGLRDSLIDAVGGSIDWNRTTNPASLTRALNKQTALMQGYATRLTDLRTAGLSAAALQRITAMDPKQAAKFAQKLQAGGQTAINEFNSAIADFDTTAGLVGDKGAAAAWADTGAEAALGFKLGMESQEGALRDTMKDLGEALLDEWKKTLGIESPSKVFALAAKQIPQGIIVGMESEKSRLDEAMRGLLTPAISSLGYGDQSTSGLGGPVGDSVNIVVNPSVGMDEEALGRAVARELDWQRS